MHDSLRGCCQIALGHEGNIVNQDMLRFEQVGINCGRLNLIQNALKPGIGRGGGLGFLDRRDG